MIARILLFLLACGASFGQTPPDVPATAPTTADRVREALRHIDFGPARPEVRIGPPSAPIAPLHPPSPNWSRPSGPGTATPRTTSAAASPTPTAPSQEIPKAGARTAGAEPSAVSTDGAIRVETDPPGADVILDQTLAGVTPLFLRGLSPGPHELEVARSGATIRRSQVRIAAGKVLNLRLPGLLPSMPSPITTDLGFLTLDVKPAGASVYLPGRKLLGSTPLDRAALAPGFYTITVEAPGHGAEEREVRIDRGRETRIVAQLARKRDLVETFRSRRRNKERDLYLGEARRLSKRANYDLALERTRQALAADPRSIEAYELLAQIYLAQGDKPGYAEARAKIQALGGK